MNKNMITEDYVSFETAKLLKEKEFCEPCFGYYSEYVDNWRTFKIWKRYPKTYDTVRNDGYVLVPTIQMAMKWLRKVHNLYIEITTNSKTNEFIVDSYRIDIVTKNFDTVYVSSGYDSYEDAAEAAIKYCLENLITPSSIPE